MTLTTQGLLCILWIFSSNKAKSHEKASGHCAGAFVCPGLLWVGAASQGNLKEWAASLLLKEGEELTSPADFLSFSSSMRMGRALSGFSRCYCDPHQWLFLFPHQVCEGWMWSRVPQPWVSRREPATRFSVIFPLPHRVWIGIFRTLGAASSTCFTFLQGQSRMED